MIQLWFLAVPAQQLILFASFLGVIIIQQKERGYIKSAKSRKNCQMPLVSVMLSLLTFFV